MPQLIAAGKLVTVPPELDLVTVRVNLAGAVEEPYSYAPKSIAEPAILVLPSLSEYNASRTVLRVVLSVKRFLNVSELGSNPLSIAIEPAPRRKLASAKFRLPSLGWTLFFLTIV